MTKTVCEHNWIEEYDHREAQACYQDGYEYYPSYSICTKCHARKKIQYGQPKPFRETLIGWIKNLPIFLLTLIIAPLYFILMPIIMIVGAIISDISQYKKK
jgi:hypothetical protein